MWEGKTIKVTESLAGNELTTTLTSVLKGSRASQPGCPATLTATDSGPLEAFTEKYFETAPIYERAYDATPGKLPKSKSYEMCYTEEEPELGEHCGYNWQMFTMTHTWDLSNPGDTNKGTYTVSGSETVFAEPEGPCTWTAVKGKKTVAYEGHYFCNEFEGHPYNKGTFRLLK